MASWTRIPARKYFRVLFGRPPGVSWDLMRWPAWWALASVSAWGVTSHLLDLDTDQTLSALEVTAAVAGLGGVVIAIAGVSKALSRPQPELRITVDEVNDVRGKRWEVTLTNRGDEPARGVSVIIDWDDTQDLEKDPVLVTAEGLTGTFYRNIWLGKYGPEIHRDEQVFLGRLRLSPLEITAGCRNGSQAEWTP